MARRTKSTAAMVLAIPVLTAVAATVSNPVTEDFDAPGSAWSDSILPDLRIFGDSEYDRVVVTAAANAPDTTPPLPVNVGGDKAGRYRELPGGIASTSYAFTAEVPASEIGDVVLDGYVAFGVVDGTPSIGFVARASEGPFTVNAYTAIARRIGPSTVELLVARIRNNAITLDDIFARSQGISFDFDAENLRLRLHVVRNRVAASAKRVHVVDGRIMETPIDLLAAPGDQFFLAADDPELAVGRAGVRGFVRSNNEVYVDDLTIDTCPADLDGNGAVDFADVLGVLAAWGTCGGLDCPADLSANGMVDFSDFFAIGAAWGPCPGS